MSAVTAKNFNINEAPARITLLGERSRPESAMHIIEFPGGAIELSRIDDDHYWAHIIINHGQALECFGDGLAGATGEVVDSRLDRRTGRIEAIDDAAPLQQIAILIRSTRP